MRDHIVEGAAWIERLLVANPMFDPGEQCQPGSGADAASSRDRLFRTGIHAGHPRITVLINLGMYASFAGDMPRSVRAREEAVACARQLGDRHGLSQALIDLAQSLRTIGDLDRAMRLGEEGLSLAREVGHSFGLWRTHGMFGDVVLARGDAERALALYEESLREALKMGGPWQIAQSQRRLAMVVWQQGDLDRTTMLLQEAVARFATIGVRRGRHWATLSLGEIGLQRDDLPCARRWFGEALALCYAVDRNALVTCFAGAATTLAAAADDDVRTTSTAIAQLLGAAEALRTQLNRPTLSNEQVLIERAEAVARIRLGDAAFEAALAEGAALPLEEAVAFAVAELAHDARPT